MRVAVFRELLLREQEQKKQLELAKKEVFAAILSLKKFIIML